MHLKNILVNKRNYSLVKVVSDLKFGHLFLGGTSFELSNLGGGTETSNFNVDFNVGKSEEFGVPLCEIINFEHWRS